MKFILLTCCVFLLNSLQVVAQTQIKGKVKDKADKPIELANVTLKDAEGNIIKFVQTNKNGEYSLAVDGNIKAFSIEATCIGYKKASILLADTAKDYDLVLEES